MNKLGNIKHGGHGTLTYARWKSMMQRVRTAHYATKGITVCERWHNYATFLADMGECQNKGLTLERINNTKGYEPSNCKWATMAEQNQNRDQCILLTHNGITQNATAWANQLGWKPTTLIQRLRLGWTHERALTQPIKARTLRKRGHVVAGDIGKVYRKAAA